MKRGNRKKLFFTVRAVKQWHTLPREVVETLSLEILRTQLDTAPSDLLWVTLSEQGVALDDGDPEVLPRRRGPVSL